MKLLILILSIILLICGVILEIKFITVSGSILYLFVPAIETIEVFIISKKYKSNDSNQNKRIVKRGKIEEI